MNNGHLKCVKKEIPYYGIVNSTSTTTITLGGTQYSTNKYVKETLYHPAHMWDVVKNDDVRVYIQNRVIELATRKGINVPERFTNVAIDWLSYPLIREIGSLTLCRNLTHLDRELLAPTFDPMNFKQLVHHYYGASTPKMLQEIWKIICIGGEYKQIVFTNDEIKDQYFRSRNPDNIYEDKGDRVIEWGNIRINPRAFSLGSAIFKAMGFDYFYQALSRLSYADKLKMPESTIIQNHNRNQIESDLKTILKSVSPAKFLNVLLPPENSPDLYWLSDTARMIREYEDPKSIPKSLLFQYPTGLVVDFKFKTMKELHDKISTQYTIIKTEASKREIHVADRYMLLHGMEKNGLRLAVPQNTSTLAVWGKLLNICVASYGDRAVDGSTLLLGVEKDNSIKYCIEFSCLRVPRTLSDTVHCQIQDNVIAPMVQVPIVFDVYPALEEKHVGVTPEDTTIEEEVYYEPRMIQFRGERNCSPTQEDRNSVQVMLINWVKMNFDFLKEIKGIFQEYYSGSVMNADHINDAMRYAANAQGIPNQIWMNPQAYQALNAIQIQGNVQI